MQTYCKFKTPSGHTCQLAAEQNELCYWHNDAEIKIDPKLKEKLEDYARQHNKMTYFRLRNTDLSHINLVNHGKHSGYELTHTDLYRANLQHAHLFAIDLSFSSLMKADMRGANLHNANLEHTNLLGVKLEEAKLEGINWGDVVKQEWQAQHAEDVVKQKQLYAEAEEIYRNIGRVMRNQGMSSEIGWFLYREMVTRRKQLPRRGISRIISKFIDLFCGYGEKPMRLVYAATLIIISFALLYAGVGLQHNGSISGFSHTHTLAETTQVFFNSLYFSIVTFTTLGYGDFSPIGLSRIIASIQAFTGSFTIALFVVVFVRRMTR